MLSIEPFQDPEVNDVSFSFLFSSFSFFSLFFSVPSSMLHRYVPDQVHSPKQSKAATIVDARVAGVITLPLRHFSVHSKPGLEGFHQGLVDGAMISWTTGRQGQEIEPIHHPLPRVLDNCAFTAVSKHYFILHTSRTARRVNEAAKDGDLELGATGQSNDTSLPLLVLFPRHGECKSIFHGNFSRDPGMDHSPPN